ncbi:hypothetical protein [Streptomyces sp. NPDC029721]|uniref:hypothetical protein n=1 Tax=Streptomyces sp. NPDC029721 TaxID=3157090 RepID=UPI0034031335
MSDAVEGGLGSGPDGGAGRFTALSERLTGFGTAELEATGLVEVYRAVAEEQLGPARYERLLSGPWQPDESADGDRAEAARAVTILWYTGSWPGPAPFVVSPRAHAEALVWKAAGVVAPASVPAGYGSWAERPAEAEGAGR